jgi:phosphoglycolate phosphatase-like HAD superfamily hydrolase
MKLLLFDVDGTLLHANGAGRTAIECALSDLCDRPISTDRVTFSGKTDPAIMRAILEANGLDADPSLIEEALDVYEETAHNAFDPNTVDVLPGITELLGRLAPHQEVHLGLLTGNIESMAYRKLNAVDLDHHFAFGAFGSDHPERHHLPPVAVARALAHTGHQFRGADVVIIGDTRHDIHCGRGIGAFSVAVCTGRYERSELAPHGPDVLLDDLSDPEEFIQAVLG